MQMTTQGRCLGAAARKAGRAGASCGLILFLIGCGSDNSAGPSLGLRSLAVVPSGGPSIESDGDGRTRILVSFVARGEDSRGVRALTGNETQVEYLLDDHPVGGESVLARDEIAGDLFYTMVLDGSYSMLVDHDPPAFAPMLAAARRSVQDVTTEWQSRGVRNQVKVDWLWFDDYVYYPDDKAFDNLLLIPQPAGGENDTRLFGSVNFMFERHLAEVQNGYAARAQDRHVMVVFSDGRDNRSYFVTHEINEPRATPFPHVRHRPGRPTDGHEELVARLQQARNEGRLPNLVLHSIGLGTNIAAGPLEALATSQGGAFVQNPSSTALASLFEAITREVVSVQTVGLKLPLRPGRYRLTVRVRVKEQPALFTDHLVEFEARG
jgi:hypothetical protein